MIDTDTLSNTPRAEMMMATPGFAEFKGNYTQFIELSESDQANFLTHDIVNMTSTLFAALVNPEVVKDEVTYQRYLSQFEEFNSGRHIFSENIDIVKNMLGQVDGLDEGLLRNYFADQAQQRINQLQAFKRILPLMMNSVDFLHRPTSSNLEKLLSAKTDMQTILDLTMIDHKVVNNYPVDGPNAVILINLLNNAKKFGGRDVQLEMKQDSITISNPSNYPLPEKLFELGGKGGNGNRGYGLFLAQKLYAPMVGHNVTASSNLLPTGKYDVRFTLASNRSK